MNRRALISTAALIAMLAGCSSAGIASPGTDGTVVVSTDPSHTTDPTDTTDPAGDVAGGWIGGEPEWIAPYASGSGSPTGVVESSSADSGSAPYPATDSGTGRDASAGDMAEPMIEEEQGPLRAGSVDDNADLPAFLEYQARLQSEGVTTRPFDATGRIVVSVTGANGLPVHGAAVTVSAGDTEVATIRTTTDGTARFLPALYDASAATQFTIAVGDVSTTAAPGAEAALTIEADGGAQAPVALDIMFLLDATGSMGDEIDQLKTTIDTVAARLEAFETQPDVHLAMTLYRDEGDTFVTSTFDFTGDIDAFRSALDVVVADGGGDYPEALEEGLAASLTEPAWRDPATTVQLVFLVADAPPRLDRQVPVDYPASIADAISRGIKVIPIASSESDDQAEAVFRQLAVATGGRFVFLSYGAGGAATGDSTDIEETDYEELSLDDLVVRLVAEELTSLTGSDAAIPVTPTTLPPTTNPDGQ